MSTTMGSRKLRLRTLRFGISCVALSLGLIPFAACRAENPFAPTETTSSDTVTWRKRGEDVWKLDAVPISPVVGEFGRTAGLVCGEKLISFAADGIPEKNILTFAKPYALVGLRPKYIVAVTAEPAHLEILDRDTGLVLRSAALGEGKPLSLQLHPVLSVAYVSLSRTKTFAEGFSAKGFFAVVDEDRAEVRHSDDHLGQTLAVDPSGRFLLAGYSDTVPLGSRVVRIPVGIQPHGMGFPFPTRPSPYTPTPGRPQPRPGYAPAPDRLQVITQSGKITLIILFDLEDEHAPKPLGLFACNGFERGLHVSYDGRRLTANNSGSTIEGLDPLDPKAAVTKYQFNSLNFGGGTDFAHHPAIPVSMITVGDKLAFLNTDSGSILPEEKIRTLPYGRSIEDRSICFSPDGRYVLSAVRKADGESSLVRVAVPLSTTNRDLLEARLAKKTPSTNSSTPTPLAGLEALRGGLETAMRTSEITKKFSDAVVIVRSSSGSGTGFVVGTSGYILTCAHCIPRLLPTVVAYKAVGGTGEETEIEADAEIVLRDAKLDLALLKIKTGKPLAAVVLASPLNAEHGEEVTVIANPVLGDTILKNTITTGVVSNHKLEIEGDDYIQSSAAVNPGSSGGPMFDQHGRVVGMVVLKGKIEGVGFAIPSRRLTEFLLRSATFAGDDGKLLRSWVNEDENSERKGAFVKADDAKLTILEAGNPIPQSLDVAKLSPGDRAFLKLMTTAISKRTPLGTAQ